MASAIYPAGNSNSALSSLIRGRPCSWLIRRALKRSFQESRKGTSKPPSSRASKARISPVMAALNSRMASLRPDSTPGIAAGSFISPCNSKSPPCREKAFNRNSMPQSMNGAILSSSWLRPFAESLTPCAYSRLCSKEPGRVSSACRIYSPNPSRLMFSKAKAKPPRLKVNWSNAAVVSNEPPGKSRIFSKHRLFAPKPSGKKISIFASNPWAPMLVSCSSALMPFTRGNSRAWVCLNTAFMRPWASKSASPRSIVIPRYVIWFDESLIPSRPNSIPAPSRFQPWKGIRAVPFAAAPVTRPPARRRMPSGMGILSAGSHHCAPSFPARITPSGPMKPPALSTLQPLADTKPPPSAPGAPRRTLPRALKTVSPKRRSGPPMSRSEISGFSQTSVYAPDTALSAAFSSRAVSP